MTIQVAAFARVGEIVRSGPLNVPPGATVGVAWEALCTQSAELRSLRASTRLAVNGTFADAATILRDGDELALLPPFGGG